MEKRRIAVTSPAGNWSYFQLLGASVHINSLAVSKSMFGYDEDKTYIINNIKIRVNPYGDCTSSIYLVGISTPFNWKDLEIIGLDLSLYPDAICSNYLCCGTTLCGYSTDVTTTTSTTSTISESDSGSGDGPVIG